MQTKKHSNILLQNQYDFVFVIPLFSPFLKVTYTKKPLLFGNLQNNHILAAKLAKIHVVKNLLKSNYGRPFFVCSDQSNPCSFIQHVMDFRASFVKSKRNYQQRSFILLLCSKGFMQLLRMGARRTLLQCWPPPARNQAR